MIAKLRKLENKLAKATDTHYVATMDKSWDKEELESVYAIVTAEISEAQHVLRVAEEEWDERMECHFGVCEVLIAELETMQAFLKVRIKRANWRY